MDCSNGFHGFVSIHSQAYKTIKVDVNMPSDWYALNCCMDVVLMAEVAKHGMSTVGFEAVRQQYNLVSDE